MEQLSAVTGNFKMVFVIFLSRLVSFSSTYSPLGIAQKRKLHAKESRDHLDAFAIECRFTALLRLWCRHLPITPKSMQPENWDDTDLISRHYSCWAV